MPQKAFSKIWLLVILAVVITAGVLVWQRLQKPVEGPAPGEEQPPAEVEQPPTDETANWKTYTNTRFGYSLRYPNDFVLHSPQSTAVREIVSISKEKVGWFDIDVSWDWKYADVITAEKVAELISNTNKITEPYTLGGVKGVKVSFDNSLGGRTTAVIVVKDGNLYDISCPTHSQIDAPSALKTFNQILSTFRFLE